MQKQSIENFVRDIDTVQGALEAALLNLLPKPLITPTLILSSRTDAGVHALCNTAHVELENRYNRLYNSSDVKRATNNYFKKCGHFIRLLDFIPVTNDFHARYRCKSRTYIYRFMIPKIPGEHRISVVEGMHSYFIRDHNFDINRVQNALQLFMGTRDFSTFSAKAITDRKIKYTRSLNAFTLEEVKPLMFFDPLSENFRYWHFTCKSRSFLYNQVRRMVGSLIALGLGKITEKDIMVMLQVPSHDNWDTRIQVIPSIGLHLVNVEYDTEELKRMTLDEQEWEPHSEEQKEKLELKE
ncbi:tRNA pseudouridine synthase-like 1 isoform X2 [Ooceraea biroi]|nr:tRNA pseudouridine synthase-like 1 isoform X2 [Ooceraea biroi]